MIKPYQVVLCGFLLGAIILSVFNFPTQIQPFSTENNTPTPTPAPKKGSEQLTLESGDTTGLMIGAAVIVVIILAGVVISQNAPFLLRKSGSE